MALVELTVVVGCDVLQADGGTRTAAITGACVALVDAFELLLEQDRLATSPLRRMIAAVSVGVCNGAAVLDLDYPEDSAADTDLNVVMDEQGGFIEVQGTAEGEPFSGSELEAMLGLEIGRAAGRGRGEVTAAA